MSVLTGYKVVDISSGRAGPIVGMFLADFGAEVVKVETCAGDRERSEPGFVAYNRGKKGITIDPKDQKQVARLHKMIAGADVLITGHSFQHEILDSSVESLSERYPHLVIVETPPYLENFTPWYGGHESAALVASVLGQAARQSSIDGEPVDSVYPTVVCVQGLWASTCTIAALIEKETSGFGQIVSVSAVNAMQQMGIYNFTSDPDAPDPFTGIGSAGPHPTYRPVKTKNGRWFISGALGGKFEPMVLEIVGLGDVLKDPRVNGNFWNVFRDPKLLFEVLQRIHQAFLQRDAEEWQEMFIRAGIPCGIMDEREKWLDHPQVRAAGLRVEVTDAERGPVVMPGIPFTLTKTPGKVKSSAPTLGQHNDSDFNWEPKQIPNSRPPLRPGPLYGYTFLNLGTFVATPYAGALLAELGGNVIKVEPPVVGDPFRVPGFAVNRGMSSLSLDLKDSDGLKTFYEVVKNAHVVLDGLRPGITKRLKIDYDSLSKVNSSIIAISCTGFGENGPLSDLAAVDMVLQGMSGMMTAEGGDGDPVGNTIAIIDTTTAVLNALASVAALLHKVRSGEGQRVWTSLLGSATYLQLDEITAFKERKPAAVGNNNFKGSIPFSHMYKASDSWFRIQSFDDVAAVSALKKVLDVDVSAGSDRERIAKIESASVKFAASELVAKLNQAGLPSVLVRKVSQVLRDPHLLMDDFVTIRQANGDAFIVEPTRLASFSRTRRFGNRLPPGIGEHTTEILKKAGVEESRIAALNERQVITCGKPMENTIGVSYR